MFITTSALAGAEWVTTVSEGCVDALTDTMGGIGDLGCTDMTMLDLLRVQRNTIA